MMSTSHIQALDESLAQTISIAVKEQIDSLLRRESIQQKDLASRLGMTPEYISEIKSGRKVPSYQVFLLLQSYCLSHEAFENSNPEIAVGSKKRGQ
jgi:transcriptional regulator with XRE-family HTH domain